MRGVAELRDRARWLKSWVSSRVQPRWARLAGWLRRPGAAMGTTAGIAGLAAWWAASRWGLGVEQHFAVPASYSALQAFLLAVGSALVGAAAIVVALVLFALQTNVERMPHGLFRALSLDARLLLAFLGAFVLSVAVAAVSLVTGIRVAVFGAAWSGLMVLNLLLYAYRRSLELVSPSLQLQLVRSDARSRLSWWSKRADEAARLTAPRENAAEAVEDAALSRVAFLRRNGHWTSGAGRDVRYAASFARHYSQRGDHEVAQLALGDIVEICRAYIAAKGRFFPLVPLFEHGLETDAFLNDAMEHLRREGQAAFGVGDEREVELVMAAFAELAGMCVRIDYGSKVAPRYHAGVAGGYLSDMVEGAMRRGLPDVVMAGVRLMGGVGQVMVLDGAQTESLSLWEKITGFGGAALHRDGQLGVVQVAGEQLEAGVKSLLITELPDARFVFKAMTRFATHLAKATIAKEKDGFTGVAAMPGASFFSASNPRGVAAWLTQAANAVAKLNAADPNAVVFIRNMETWSEGLAAPCADLLAIAVQRQSMLAMQLVPWCLHVAKILQALANTAACPEDGKRLLRRAARALVAVLGRIPGDEASVGFAETFRMSELLFEAGLDAHERGADDVQREVEDLLLAWALKAGRHETGWGSLEHALLGAATLAVATSSDAAAFEQRVGERFKGRSLPETLRKRAVRELCERAANPSAGGHWSSPIDHAMSEVDHGKLRALLESIVRILQQPQEEGSAQSPEAVRSSAGKRTNCGGDHG